MIYFYKYASDWIDKETKDSEGRTDYDKVKNYINTREGLSAEQKADALAKAEQSKNRYSVEFLHDDEKYPLLVQQAGTQGKVKTSISDFNPTKNATSHLARMAADTKNSTGYSDDLFKNQTNAKDYE